ncbi:MAG: response regulator [Anaerolineae bacterium]|jgi:DNA-binding NarL/FixJ family response regulator|nr:response regulator [Anaerolineae bacterium]MBT7189355.1 response regulator [Anaerolineae bacterium]MBT7989984.1 response regulator [Anaerolineae bacterium]
MQTIQILLADDHAIVRAGIRNLVEEIPNVEVIAEVGDGPSLFEILSSKQPDLLLVDLSMPDFNPIKSIREIRLENPIMKILVVSAYDDEPYVHGLLEAGVDGYHLKDQPLSDLKLAISRIIAGERWVSSSLLPKLVGKKKPTPNVPILTSRQRDILKLLQEGFDNQSIAIELNLSIKTIENHLTRIYRQLEVQSRLEAVKYINRHPKVLGIVGQNFKEQKQEVIPSRHDISILVVDDNQRYLRQIQRMLARVCPRAILYEADSALGAQRLSEKIQPQLAFVDVVLGEGDGIRCARRIKASSKETRIVMISAYPDREFRRLSMEAGAVAFLDKKDLDAHSLKEVVEDMIG